MLKNWYWRNWREKDNLAAFADLWDRFGIQIGITFVLFMIAALSFFLVSLFQSARDDFSPWPTLAGMFVGLAAFFYAGLAVASLAHSTHRRIQQLEQRLAELTDIASRRDV